MPRYLVKTEILITVQEGDTPAPVEFIVPDILDMSTYHIRFKVFGTNRQTIFTKTDEDSSITVTGQLISIPMLVSDTTGKSDTHRWEAELYNNTPEIITIGRGPFVIKGQNIK